MIVPDASAVVEAVLGTPAGKIVEKRVVGADVTLHAPHLLDLEVSHVLRKLVRYRSLAPARGGLAVHDFMQLQITRYDQLPFLGRIWDLRDTFTAYDAAYVTLCESLDATLLTCDRRLAESARNWVGVELV